MIDSVILILVEEALLKHHRAYQWAQAEQRGYGFDGGGPFGVRLWSNTGCFGTLYPVTGTVTPSSAIDVAEAAVSAAVSRPCACRE